MLRILPLLVCAIAASAPTPSRAQTSERKGGPEKGTWGAEASVGGSFVDGAGQSGSLIRFVSPKTALVGGFSFSRSDGQGVRLEPSTVRFTPEISTVALQAGLRRYGGTGLGLRPVFGAGVLYSRVSIWEAPADSRYGGYAEAGAAWFFNPHVSLGVLGGLSAAKQDQGWSSAGSLARLTGAVYF